MSNSLDSFQNPGGDKLRKLKAQEKATSQIAATNALYEKLKKAGKVQEFSTHYF